MSTTDERYADREQTLIKHSILKSYLQSFAHKILFWADGLIYVDGFAGPWQSSDEESFKDSSFGIALDQLRIARNFWRDRGKSPKVECFFLERDPKAFRLLESFCRSQADVDVRPLNKSFEEAIPQIVQHIKSKGRSWFPFILIDPKGWKGFGLAKLAPLIRLQPSEVLVNFMTGHIHRFIQAENLEIQEGFRLLYDSDEYAERVAGLTGQDREDAIMLSYAERLAAVGHYPFVSTALVQNPTKDRTHYHLIYATRRIEGIEVFKAAERKALRMAPIIRAKAKERQQSAKTGQPSLFTPEQLPDMAHLERLQTHFENKAAAVLADSFIEHEELDYDTLYSQAMRFPMVQEAFLRSWLEANTTQIASNPTGKPKPRSGHRFHNRRNER